MNGVKHIVERPKHGVLFGICNAERAKSVGNAVAPLFQLPALRRVHFIPVLHIVVYDLTDGIDVCLWQTVHIPRLRLINGRNEVRLKELRPAVRVFQLIVDFLDGIPETHILNAVLHRMLASFLAVADDVYAFVFIHRDVHVAVLGDELAQEQTSCFVLLQKEYFIEPWEVVHHTQVSPCLADDDFIAPHVGL